MPGIATILCRRVLAPALWCSLVLAADPGGDFTLTTHDGAPYSTQSSRGQVLVLVFGYTWCPDVCPTLLAAVAAALAALGEDANRVQPLFVSLDPDRDTPRKLRAYVTSFHPRIIGLTGSAQVLKRVAAQYNVRYQFVGRDSQENYTLDHTASFYVVDTAGRLARLLPYGLPPQALVEAVRELLP